IAAPDEALQSVLTRLHETEVATIPIVDNGHLVGLITIENLAEYLMVQSALAESEKKRGDVRFKADFLAVNRRAIS
ncbi:MAG TPA: CBS domain-containing protein, partial [Terriglobales bacterium]|nr:CBS domain-containing protein [Terriglobales bacterium]